MDIPKLESAVIRAVTFDLRVSDTETKQYELVLDWNAIIRASEVTGLPLHKSETWSYDSLSPSELSTILWVAFNKRHPEVTLEDVRSWIAPWQFGPIWVALVDQCWPGVFAKAKAAANGANGAGESEPNLTEAHA